MRKLTLLVALVLFACGSSQDPVDFPSNVKTVNVIQDTKCELDTVSLQIAFMQTADLWWDTYGEELVFIHWDTADYPELSSYAAWYYHIEYVVEPTLIFLPAYTAGPEGGLGMWPLALVWTFDNEGWLEGAIMWELVNVFYPEDNDWAYVNTSR
jgi:hypothetical protein